MTTLVRLYPRAWRDRYEAEFLGILQARPPSRRDRLDIIRGALDARLHPEVPGSPEASHGSEGLAAARWAGAAAILAGLGSLAWTGLVLRYFKGWGAGEPEHAALGSALSAITFLSLSAAHGLLAVAGQRSMRGGGAPGASVAAVAFLFSATGGGLAIALGVAGSIVLAAAMAGRTISGWLSAVWITASVLLLGAMLAFTAGGGQNVSLLALMAPFGLAWLFVGLTVLRRGVPSPAIAPDPSG